MRVVVAARRAAVPLAGAVVLWLLGRRRAVVAATIIGVVVLLVGLVAPRLARRFDRFIARLGRGAGLLVSYGLSTLAWVLVVLPTWVVSRLVGYSQLDPGWASAGSAWNHVRGGRGPDGRPEGTTRMGALEAPRASTARRRGRLRLLIVLPLLAAVVAVAFRAAAPGPATGETAGSYDLRRRPLTATKSGDGPVSWAGVPVDEYAHDSEPWAKDFFRELTQATPLQDYVLGQRLRDFRGRYLNIVEGRRVSYTPVNPERTVWFFGGSTMFGIGQRDGHTIPSEFARLAERDGVRVRAVNFGVSADVNWVETLRFAEALSAAKEKPDLVVFYDGVNDFGLASERIDEGSIDPAVLERAPVSDQERERHRQQRVPGEVPDRLGLTVKLGATQYRRGVETARQLGAANGVPVVFVWQPSPYARAGAPADGELYRRIGFDVATLPVTTKLYADIRTASGVNPIDLTGILDGVQEPVYIDGSHTNELGANVVAGGLYRAVRRQLVR